MRFTAEDFDDLSEGVFTAQMISDRANAKLEKLRAQLAKAKKALRDAQDICYDAEEYYLSQRLKSCLAEIEKGE